LDSFPSERFSLVGFSSSPWQSLGIFNTAWLDFFTRKRNLNFRVLAVAASVSSLTLKGNARVQALAAGALLVLFAMLWLSREMP